MMRNYKVNVFCIFSLLELDCNDQVICTHFTYHVTDPFNESTRRYGASVHFGVVVVELINCNCGGIERNQIW